MRLNYANTKEAKLEGLSGLPDYYPVPSDQKDMVFYIQRNHNQNTVVYQLNKNLDGFVSLEKPLNVFWKEYEHNGVISEINLLQKQLAYGYNHKVINNNTVEFSIVSYPSYKMYLVKRDDNYVVVSKFHGQWALLTNIYVYAEEFGAFPNVKYIEFYGVFESDGLPCYEKVNIAE